MKVLIQVETIVRELKGKLWLALNLAKVGHRVAIGGQRQLNQNIWRIQPDIYIGGSANSSDSREQRYRALQTAGSKVVVIETESGIYTPSEEYAKMRMHSNVLEHVDRYLAWGQKQADALDIYTSFPTKKVDVTGPPRFDLLKEDFLDIYRREGDELSIPYDDFVLVITNFTLMDMYDDEDDQFEEMIQHQRRYRSTYIEAIEWLSANTEYTVVTRPHPTENHEPYQEAFADLDDVFVVHEGPVRAWIPRARAVVHPTSTVGIESSLMGTPTISYQPVNDDFVEEDRRIPFGDVVSDKRSIARLLVHYKEHTGKQYALPSSQISELEYQITNVSTSATPKIVDIIDSLDPSEETTHSILDQQYRHLLKQFSASAIGLDRTESLIEAVGYNSYDDLRHRFPGLTHEALKAEITKFENVIDVSDIQIDRIGENMFWLTAN